MLTLFLSQNSISKSEFVGRNGYGPKRYGPKWLWAEMVMGNDYPKTLESSLSSTGSALLRTDLSPLTNGIWEIHAGCSCFLHLRLLAKFG